MEEQDLKSLFKERGSSVPATVQGEDPKSLFSQRENPRPSLGKKADVTAQGVVGGVIEEAPAIAGTVAGAKVGAAIGAFGGPAAPITVPLGAGVGAVGGYFAGREAGQYLRQQAATVVIPWTGESLTFDNVESIPKELRPYAVGGESFGRTAAFAVAPYIAVRDGFRFAPNLSGRILNSMIEGAAQAPGHFAVAEMTMGVSAGIGAGVGQSVAPGNQGAIMGGEIVGGFANPTRWVLASYRIGVNQAKKAISGFSEAAQRSRAQDFLVDVVTRHGEDPAALAQALRETDIPGLKLTAGQKTGSPALLALEEKLKANSAQFGEASRKAAEDGLESLKLMIRALETVGDPQSLRAAAQMRSDYFNTLLNGRVRQAEDTALRLAADIDTSAPGSVAEYGRQTKELLTEAMTDVREVESTLWGAVDTTIPAQSEGIVAAYGKLRSELLPEESLPDVVEGFITRTAGEAIDTGELIRFRSRMLALARESAAKNEWSDARIYGELAEATLDDLAQANITQPAYDAARNYSFQLNEVFSRTYAGKALERGKSGAARIPPELVMEKAFGGSGAKTELELRQLGEAAEFAGAEYLSRMVDLQENMLRAAASQAIDTATGRIMPQRLARFVRDNGELLQRFPGVAEQLADAGQAEQLLRGAIAGRTQAERAIQNRAAFAQILGREDPSQAVGRILSGANPRRELQQLVRLTANNPEQRAGLRSSLFMHAYNQANRGGTFSFRSYRETFNKSLGGKESLRSMMVREGVASKKAMDMLDGFLDRAGAIQDALVKGAPIEDIPDRGAAIYDFAVRISGARLAAVAPTGGAHSLIVGGAGSKAARAIMDKIPRNKTHEFLIELSKNPEMMAGMLEDTGKNTAAQRKFALQMNAFLWQSAILRGYPAAEDATDSFFLGP